MYHSWLRRKCWKPENRYCLCDLFFKHFVLWNYDKSWKVKANWHSLSEKELKRTVFLKRTVRQRPWKCKIKHVWPLLLNTSFLRRRRLQHVMVTRQSAKLGLGPGGTSWVNTCFAVNAVYRLEKWKELTRDKTVSKRHPWSLRIILSGIGSFCLCTSTVSVAKHVFSHYRRGCVAHTPQVVTVV